MRHLRLLNSPVVCCVPLCLVAVPVRVQAQEPVATLSGTVRAAESGQLLPGAEILVDGRLLGRSAEDGGFRVEVTPGERVVEVRLVGHRSARAHVTVEEAGELHLEVTLPRLTAVLEGVTVEGVRPALRPKLSEFERRKERWPAGQFFERPDIERHAVRHLSEFFRTVPGVKVECIDKWCTGRILRASGGRVLPSFMRPDTTLYARLRDGCFMEVYLDGARYVVGPEGIDGISLESVEAIEVYVGSSQVPVELAARNARCGVVVIWTRDGL